MSGIKHAGDRPKLSKKVRRARKRYANDAAAIEAQARYRAEKAARIKRRKAGKRRAKGGSR